MVVLPGRRWPEQVEVRVRVGVHSGRPTLTATGYIGLAVHVTARVGGQLELPGAPG